MNNYFISVEEDSLKKHPEFTRLTNLGEPVIWENRHRDRFACYAGKGDDGRIYFHSPEDELGEVVRELLRGCQVNTDLKIKLASKESMPKNLFESYKKFFQETGILPAV